MGGTSRDVLFPPLSRPTAPEVLDTSTVSNWPGGLAAPDGFDVNGRPPPGERLREKTSSPEEELELLLDPLPSFLPLFFLLFLFNRRALSRLFTPSRLSNSSL